MLGCMSATVSASSVLEVVLDSLLVSLLVTSRRTPKRNDVARGVEGDGTRPPGPGGVLGAELGDEAREHATVRFDVLWPAAGGLDGVQQVVVESVPVVSGGQIRRGDLSRAGAEKQLNQVAEDAAASTKAALPRFFGAPPWRAMGFASGSSS